MNRLFTLFAFFACFMGAKAYEIVNSEVDNSNHTGISKVPFALQSEHGIFVASSNPATGLEYDFDNAIKLVYDEDLAAYVGKVGTEGNSDTWVSQVMVSTVRGNDDAFKAATIKASGTIDGTEDTWLNYFESPDTKIDLPAAGVWQIAVDNENTQVNFYQIEGDAIIEEGVLEHGIFVASSNPATGLEYDFGNAIKLVYDEDLAAYVGKVGTEGNSDTWVSQVMVSTVRGNDDAFKAATIKASGTIDGTEDTWLNYFESPDTKIDLPAAGVWQIAVDNENTQVNFYQIEGDEIIEHSGISSVVYNKTVFAVTYNLVGQCVTKDYKGIVVKNGKKAIVK